MSLVLIGLSHHTSPVEVRERLAFPGDALPGAFQALRTRLPGAGIVILSTCNRVEFYINHDSPPDAIRGVVQDFLSTWHGVPGAAFGESLYLLKDREAVKHLFRVVSGLDSMVVGEGQILGQVHDAYHVAHAQGVTDKIISALFQRGFSVAKRVRTQTEISAGRVSVSSVAVDLAASLFHDLSDKTVMIIGSGKTGSLTLESLTARGVTRVLTVNRTLDRAQSLADRFQGEPLAFADLSTHLHEADIVITSTGAPHFILHQHDFQATLPQRDGQPILVIDIAVPRDVDPAVNELDSVYLYDMDDLAQVADANLEARRDEVGQCMEIVERSVSQFWNWFQGLVAEPTIVSMAKEIDAIRENELQKTLAALQGLSQEQRDEIAYLTRRIVNGILQRPMSQLKRAVVEHDPETVLYLARRLFGLDEKA